MKHCEDSKKKNLLGSTKRCAHRTRVILCGVYRGTGSSLSV